jgi:hypothetical protein
MRRRAQMLNELTEELLDLEASEKADGAAPYAFTVYLCCSCSCCFSKK